MRKVQKPVYTNQLYSPLLLINSLAVVVKNPLALAFYSILSSDEDQVE
jgi:hypothetical protein